MATRKRPDSTSATLRKLRRDAAVCKRCDLWEGATRVVFGNGSPTASLMFVGEQPGDIEDREGEPFVGPAGQLLRQALEEAGITLADVYLTNVIKHFKWEPRGKRRIHVRPNHEEVLACRLWLDAEISAVKPRAIVALGATAARAVIGPSARVTHDRARPMPSSLAPFVTLTVHPSSILRAPDPAAREGARKQFVDDLRAIAAHLKKME